MTPGEKPLAMPTAGNQEVTADNQECFLSSPIRKQKGPMETDLLSFSCPGNVICFIPRTNKQAPQEKRPPKEFPIEP